MMITERIPGDAAELARLVRTERSARLRDRYRAVLLALQGKQAPQIVQMLGRSRRSVQDWVYAYRDHGIPGLIPRKGTGRPAKITPEQVQHLRARLEAGPRPEDGVCTLRGRDIVRILQQEFGVKHTLGSIYGILERLGYSCLKPRPRHEKNDPQAAGQFKRQAPLLSKT